MGGHPGVRQLASLLGQPTYHGRAMGVYRIDLHDEGGAVVTRRHYTFRKDSSAVDFARKVIHPHVIKVWEGDRLVAELLANTPGPGWRAAASGARSDPPSRRRWWWRAPESRAAPR